MEDHANTNTTEREDVYNISNEITDNKNKENEITNAKGIKKKQIMGPNKIFGDLKNNRRNLKHRTRITSRNANTLFLLLRMVLDINVLVQKCVVLCLMVNCVSGFKEQKFAIEPQDQSAVVGSRVILPCRVVSKAGQLQWTKDDFGLGTHRYLTGYDRYKMIGSDEEGDYSLDIREVALEDDALYQCQVSSGPRGEQAIRSRYARLIVLMPPEPPKILQGPILQAIEDREVNLECVSVGGKPAAEITWVDNEGGVLTQGVTYTTEPMSDGRRNTARSVLHFRPRRHHHNQTITCQAQNTADRAYRAATIRLQVQYAPKVRMFIKSGNIKGQIQEGDTLIMGCQGSANPTNLTYKWYINNNQIVGTVNNELILKNISRKYNDATIRCEVFNAVGKSAETKTIEVAYGPSFKIRPQNVEGESGSTATLTCMVDGHPPAKILWLRYDNEHVIRVGKSSNLTVKITKETAGQYWCRASVDHYQDIEASAMVYVRGAPKITSNETQYGVEGDSVRVECVSFSIPKPDYIMWTFAGGEINTFHNQEYAFLEETLADSLTKSTLIIRKSEAKHFGKYNCTVTNEYGMDSIEINLVPDKSLPIFLIITACATVLTVVLIIMLIVMLCHRRTSKSDEKKPDITDIGKTCADQFKDSDRNSNISDLKLELRQVEGSCGLDNSNNGSETDLHPSLHLTSNLGLPLAGPVSLPDNGYDNELMKQYQRYSGDFNQPISNLHCKTQGQSNGYVPYVDYSRDYAPPMPSESQSGSLSRSMDGSIYMNNCGSLTHQTSSGLAGIIGPDVIPMPTLGVSMSGGVDVRYAATYGNPYLRGSGPLSYVQQVNTNPSAKPAPPPYYTARNQNIHPNVATTSPSSSSSSRPVTSPLASSSSTSSAQPQVPKLSPLSSGALYILPPSSHGNLQSKQITAKGNGSQLTNGTHV
ncbi:irregular chiasm C-roughest protein-like [Galleria mellonella]|uniref:Irregular chiasm C-roughest protein-like n=1 Tax=Galleria mellonella TaxID=7137 RepID=A0ABM3M9Q2_GALME|nr:irregular chiasm C-roughest protein-like [Galleria mellonella]